MDLVEAIKAGKLVHEGKRLAESTLSGIMGRMSAYTGKEVSWEQAMNSKLDLWPKEPLSMDMKITVPPVPMPGKDQLV